MKKPVRIFFLFLVFGVLVKTSAAEFKLYEWEKKYINSNYDGRYVASAGKMVKDHKTGLQWLAGPDRDTTWDEARSWVKNLSAGGGNWRMPTSKELNTLLIFNEGSRNMTPLLKTAGWWVWGKETHGYSAMLFSFGSETKYYADRDISLHRRGFAVRSSK